MIPLRGRREISRDPRVVAPPVQFRPPSLVTSPAVKGYVGTRRRGHRTVRREISAPAPAPSVGEYLRNRTVLPGLFELSPADAGLLDDATAIRSLMRANGQLGADVRLLADDGERYLDQ